MDMLRKHSTLNIFIRIVRALSATLILIWIFSNIILNAEIDIFQFLAQPPLIILIIVCTKRRIRIMKTMLFARRMQEAAGKQPKRRSIFYTAVFGSF